MSSGPPRKKRPTRAQWGLVEAMVKDDATPGLGREGGRHLGSLLKALEKLGLVEKDEASPSQFRPWYRATKRGCEEVDRRRERRRAKEARSR